LYAQKYSFPFGNSYDEDANILIGIQYSYINSRYILDLNQDWSTTGIDYGPTHSNTLPNLKSIASPAAHGMSVGIPIDFRMTDNLYANFSPSFVFINNTRVIFTDTDPEILPNERYTRNTLENRTGTNFNSFELPLSLKLRSDEKIFKNKFNRYRGFITAGARYTSFLGLTTEYNRLKHEPEKPYPLVLKNGYFSWETSVGVDIFFTHFKMSPEIKFSQSLGNVLDKRHELTIDNQFMDKLDKAFIRNIYFSLTFQ